MKRYFLYLFFILALAGCTNIPEVKLPQKPAIYGLATPIRLNPYVTTVYLADYFPKTKVIDSVKANKFLEILRLNNDWTVLLKVSQPDSLPWVSSLNVWAGGYCYSIPVFKSTKVKVSFSFKQPGKEFKNVQIKGEMTNWAPKNLAYFDVDSSWKTGFELEPGDYQYLIIADGKEELDPNNPDKVPNGFGGYNSVLHVGHIKPDSVPQMFTLSFHRGVITVLVRNHPTSLKVYFQNVELGAKFLQWQDTILKITLPANASRLKESYIRVYAANNYGFSNDLLIPLHNGHPVKSAKQLARDDFHSAVIYNVMIDRFYDGNKENDPKPLDSVLPPAQFHGGDLTGLDQILNRGYFDSLGINTIWISPIVKNVKGAWGLWKYPRTRFSAYHGYWPVSLTQIDPRFGDSTALVKLVSDLHKKDKNILLDFVAHHVHKSYWLYKEHPEYFTNLYLPDGRLNTELWDEERLTTWFDVFLPTFNTALPEIYNMIADSAVWWIKTYNLDGFRHDAAKHVHLSLWRALTRKLKLQVEIPQQRKVYQIGETYGSPQLISSYLGSGLLDAQFDFNVYDKLKAALAGGQSFLDLKEELNRSFKYYGWHNLMGYITGNQDQGRIISYLASQIPLNVWGNNLKAIGWTNPPGKVTDTVAFKKMSILLAFINTIPGVPVIYYGDEIGMPGAGDPDNRRDMQFTGLDKNQLWLRTQTAKLVHFRRSSMPLIYGDFQWLYVDNDFMVYERRYFDKFVIVALNKSKIQRNIKINLPQTANAYGLSHLGYGEIRNSAANSIEISVFPYSYFLVFD